MHEVPIPLTSYDSVYEEAKYVELRSAVHKILRMYRENERLLRGLRVWLVNSTSRGGGVAEMMPRLVAMMSEMGMEAHWLVMDVTDPDVQHRFFDFTKHLHNNVHGEGVPLDEWDPVWLPVEGDASKAMGVDRFRPLFERVGAEHAEAFLRDFAVNSDHRHDLLIVHDPQPAAMIKRLKQLRPDLVCIWRSHIGLDEENAATKAAWEFLKPYVCEYNQCVFSAAEYIPSFLKDRATVIHPGVAPLSSKNKQLSAYDISQILARAGLTQSTFECSTRGCQLVDPPFPERATVYCPREIDPGASPVTPASDPGSAPDTYPGIAFLQRPIVTQISRWDRLKGWVPLLHAWADMKMHQDEYAARVDFCSERDKHAHDVARHKALLCNACLVLAGPDPRYISDDPEGLEVLQELKCAIDNLPPRVRRDVKLIELPMSDTNINALIVNAIQRASLVVVQNSIREGFGLTATEALMKRVCFVGTATACGLRTQVRHGIDGLLVQGDPADYKNVARAVNAALGNDLLRDRLAVNGQKRAYDKFLVFSQLMAWMQLTKSMAAKLVGTANPASAAHAGEVRKHAPLRRSISLLSPGALEAAKAHLPPPPPSITGNHDSITLEAATGIARGGKITEAAAEPARQGSDASSAAHGVSDESAAAQRQDVSVRI